VFTVSDKVQKAIQWLIVGAIFFAAVAIGISTAGDYGISWDENLKQGQAMYNYVMDRNQYIFYSGVDKYYGMAFELPLTFIEKIFKITDTRDIFIMRHMMTHLLFIVGAFFFFLIVKKHFKSWWLGILGALFLMFSPRIYAHSFYNPKDLPFLSFFVISIYTLIRFADKKNIQNAIIHSIASAVLMDIRILGVILPVFTGFVFIMDLIFGERRDAKTIFINLGTLFIHYIALLFFVVLFWPYLWENPIGTLLDVLKNMSKFPWDGVVLYMGNYVRAMELPWHYLPRWIMISTPELYLGLFGVGLVAVVAMFIIKSDDCYHVRRNNILFLMWLVLPVAAVILMRSVVYDAWRHIYFVYPALLLIALSALKGMYDIGRRVGVFFDVILRITVLGVVTAGLVPVAGFMIKNYPHEDVYFNRLAGKDMKEIKNLYELEYWGLSYRKGLEYILRTDNRPVIKILGANYPCQLNALILAAKDRERLVFVTNEQEAHYFLSNFRLHKEDYPVDKSREYYSIEVGNAKILVVYKLK